SVNPPQVYTVPASGVTPAYTINLYEGSFSTAEIGSLVSSGDTIRVRVTAQDRTSRGTVLAAAFAEDTFKYDHTPALMTYVSVNASSSEVQVSYTAEDPGAPLRGSGLAGVTYKVFEVVSATQDIEMTDYDLTI